MSLILNAKIRKQTAKKLDKLRKQNLIPAVMYGFGIKPMNLIVKHADFKKIYSQGKNSLIDLIIDDYKQIKVLIKDIQYDPIKNNISHLDFYKIKQGKRLNANISINFVGISNAVKGLGGILIKNIKEIKVKCLPEDLMSKVDVDLSLLKNFNDLIKIKDLKLSDNIEVLENKDDVVVTVIKPRKEIVKETQGVQEEGGKIEANTNTKEKESDIKEKNKGFTLIELLVVISIIGFLMIAAVVALKNLRKQGRDATRTADISQFTRALAIYQNDTGGEFPQSSSGECLEKDSGVGKMLINIDALTRIAYDPLFPDTLPSPKPTNEGTGTDNAGHTPTNNGFCFYYKSSTVDNYLLCFYLESNSKSGSTGPHCINKTGPIY